MTDNSNKKHLSIVICGHVDSGKSTTTGRLIFELGGINERDMKKLQDEADRLGKSSFAFAFYMDTQRKKENAVSLLLALPRNSTPTVTITPLLTPPGIEILSRI